MDGGGTVGESWALVPGEVHIQRRTGRAVADPEHAQTPRAERSERPEVNRARPTPGPGAPEGVAGVAALLDSWSPGSQHEAAMTAARPTGTSQNRSDVLRLQRAAGNTAVTGLVQRGGPSSSPASGTTRDVQRQGIAPAGTGAPTSTQDGAAPDQTPSAPVGSPGPLGEVELPLPNVPIYGRRERSPRAGRRRSRPRRSSRSRSPIRRG